MNTCIVERSQVTWPAHKPQVPTRTQSDSRARTWAELIGIVDEIDAVDVVATAFIGARLTCLQSALSATHYTAADTLGRCPC
jgi:hypothetical protein